MNYPFEQIGRLPAPQDNAAIATMILDEGSTVTYDDQTFPISHKILEGHRFAIQSIPVGTLITSWGQPFGTALKDIAPGEYLSNAAMLTELGRRDLDFTLPDEPNFTDDIPPFVFDAKSFQPAQALPLYSDQRTFMGYARPGGRGVGTRNMIVLLGTSALTGGFVSALEARMKSVAAKYPNIDGIVAVAHTEGGHANPNNRDLLLRTLAGFMVHPNVGAVLAVDFGTEAINNQLLQSYLQEQNYPIDDVRHHFMTVSGDLQTNMDAAVEIVSGWLEPMNHMERTPQPLSELKIALQCGGSDAFSGVSGNPLAAWVAREVIRYGGSANLAETDELIGAESYALDKVRDQETVEAFLNMLKRFSDKAQWHGHSAQGNPSGGNLYRGLYNIYLKSMGAAAKRDPAVRLDYVINYGQIMTEPGYYFMDSPGNDLESIAGQVASGCNMIFFITGNGSITNFPFVPTIKIVTTTQRYELLKNEMDVNAGAYLDDTPLDDLGSETLELTIAIASGQLSVGEKAHHAQVQIWRDWRQTSPVPHEQAPPERLHGDPIPLNAPENVRAVTFPAYRTASGQIVSDRVGLIMPTSLCSGQIARLCVDQLNAIGLGQNKNISRFVTLMHTEGCGNSTEVEFLNTLLGYMAHPLVEHCLLLEHGCEKTHNAYFRHTMLESGINPEQFGWASVQLDGGIQAVTSKMIGWFEDQIANSAPPQQVEAGLESVKIGLLTNTTISPELADTLSEITRQIVSAGGSVIVPQYDLLHINRSYLPEAGNKAQPTLAYGQLNHKNGFQIMRLPQNSNWPEILTGLGATGVELILALTDGSPMAGHPMIPVIQIPIDRVALSADVLLKRITEGLSAEYTPAEAFSNVSFQITRGLMGVSL